VATLGQSRLAMELGALFSHGGASSAAALLWRFQLLDILLPAHAAHMQRHKSARKPRCRPNFLLL
jgi:Probable RNA and SrmB- binding site of polymerase A